MSVDPAAAEQALAFLIETGEKVLPLARQERLKAHMLKYTEGLLVKGMSNQGIPATIQEKHARADDRWKEAADEDAEAYAEWISLKERRDTARIAISLYQSQVKDRG
jgi:hypothetical protein